MSTLSLPMRLPSSVKGRRDGILIEGMTSCGALPLSIMDGGASGSSSTLMLRAWLAVSSDREAVTESLRDETPLMAEAGPDAASIKGVTGRELSLAAGANNGFCMGPSDAKETSSGWSSLS